MSFGGFGTQILPAFRYALLRDQARFPFGMLYGLTLS